MSEHESQLRRIADRERHVRAVMQRLIDELLPDVDAEPIYSTDLARAFEKAMPKVSPNKRWIIEAARKALLFEEQAGKLTSELRCPVDGAGLARRYFSRKG